MRSSREVAARLEALRQRVERAPDPESALRALRALLTATHRAIDALSLEASDGDTAGRLRRQFAGREAALEQVVARIARAAGTDLPVLIEGPPGSGRALVATAIHQMSARRDEPLRSTAGPTLGGPGELERAWAGAGAGSLLLLDVERLPDAAQADLLERLGDDPAPRLLATTSRDLAEEVARGLFDEDLRRRLFVLRLRLPSPRQAGDERPTLQELEREAIAARLEALSWHQQRTADSLGIDRKTLYRKIRQYGLGPPPAQGT